MISTMRRRRITSLIQLGGFGSQAVLTPAQIADAFETRVQADGGTFEAQSCLETQLTAIAAYYDQASFILTPNGYKLNKLYALKPTDGSGDLAFTRASTVSTRKSQTFIEPVATGMPRLDYLGFTCPNLLLEPDRTNIVLRSEDVSNAAWTTTGIGSLVATNLFQNLSGANDVAVSADGNTILVTSFTGGFLNLFDHTDRTAAPVFVSKIAIAAAAYVIISSTTPTVAFVTSNSENRVYAVSFATPTAMVVLDTITHGDGGLDMTAPWNLVEDGVDIIVGAATSVVIIDKTNTSAMVLRGQITSADAPLSTVTGVAYHNNIIHCASSVNDTYVTINATNRALPTLYDSIAHGGSVLLDIVHGVALRTSSTHALLSVRGSGAVTVISYADPANLVWVASLTGLTGAENIHFDSTTDVGSITLLTGDGFANVSFANPAAPTLLGSILDGVQGTNLNGANGVYVLGDTAYVACLDGSALQLLDNTNTASPQFLWLVIHYATGNYKVLESAITNVHVVRQTLVKAASALPYVCSFIIKGGLGRDYCCVQAHDGVNICGRFFNLTTGALGGTRSIGAGFTLDDSGIINLGLEGYLCWIKVTSTTSVALLFDALFSNDGTTVVYLGDVTKGFYLTAGKIIQASAPLLDSYIKTVASAVARGAADLITRKTGVTALIGQTEGTILLHVKRSWADGVSKTFSLSDGTTNNRIMIDFTTGNAINALVVAGGVTQATITNAGFTSNTEYKVAVTYQANKAALFVNGTKVGEDLTVTVPACSSYGADSGAGALPFYGNIDKIVVIKTALSDADAQTLTT